MKSLIFKMVIMFFIGMGILNYMLYLKTGKSPLSEIDFSMPSLSTVKNSIPDIDLPDIDLPTLSSDKNGAPLTVYKWVDKDGVINYSQADPKISSAEIMVVHPDTNLIQAGPVGAPEEPKPQTQRSAATAPKTPLALPTPNNVKQLMEEAKNVQTLMDERTKTLEQALEEARSQ